MSQSHVSIKKMSRRVALFSIAGTAGLVFIGCGNNVVEGAVTPVVAAAPTRAHKHSPDPVHTVRPGTTLLTYKGHTSSVVSVAWSPGSKLVASSEQKGAVHVWEAATGKLRFVCKHSVPGNTMLSWSANGKYIAGANSASIFVWNASNGSLFIKYNAQQQGVTALAFSPDSQRIATGSFDKTVQIWKATTGAHLLTYNGHNTMDGFPVTTLSWSPDGKQMVSASSLRGGSGFGTPSVKVWDTTTGKDILVFNTTDASNVVAWSPDGTRIASEEYVNGAETVQIWAAENGRGLALNIDDKGVGVQKIFWSPNSKYVALALGSYQALVPNSCVEVRSAGGDSYKLYYKGHRPNVRDVAWSPDGSRIASCSDDQTVQIWQAPQ